MRREFIPRPGHFGEHPAILSGKANTLTANTTTTFSIGGINRAAFVERLSVSAGVVPADADGAITMVVYKYDASADAAVALTGTVDLEALTAHESTAIALLTTLTDAQRTLDEGDTIRAVVTNDSAAITTQPVDLVLSAVLGILK